MNAHTPGPWTLQQLEKRHHDYDWPTYAVRSPQNVCLAVVGEMDRYESERIPANAHVMAAAPEILAALQAIMDATQTKHDGEYAAVPTSLADAALEAIKKATG